MDPGILREDISKRSDGLVLGTLFVQCEHTRTHVKGGAAAVVLRPIIRRREAKVGQLDSVSIVCHQDVFRLEISVVYSQLMAMLDGIQYLEEDIPAEFILANVLAQLGDIEEQVTLGAVLQNDVDAVRVIHDLEHGHDVWVCRGQVVKSDLALLVGNLSTLQGSAVGIELAQTLDCIANASLDINSRVDDAIGSGTKDLGQLELAFKKLSQSLLGSQRDASRGVHWVTVVCTLQGVVGG